MPAGAEEPSWAWLRAGQAHLMVARAGVPVVSTQQAILSYLYCGDVAAYRARLLAAGVAAGEITHTFYNLGGEFRVSDPDGFALMVAHHGSP